MKIQAKEQQAHILDFGEIFISYKIIFHKEDM